mgnify:FL=1
MDSQVDNLWSRSQQNRQKVVAKIAKSLEGSVIPIDEIQSHPLNPRKGDIVGIAESLEKNGQYSPVIVDARNGNILAGNHTWKAARNVLGWREIAVVHVDVDDAQAKRILLADNRTSDLATYDVQSLISLIETIKPDLDGSGWDRRSLERLYQLEDGEDIFGGSSGGGPSQDDMFPTTQKIHVGKNLLLVDGAYFAEWLEELGDKDEAISTIRKRLGLTEDPEPKPTKQGKRWGSVSGATPTHSGLDSCEWVAVEELELHPENARQGDIGAISESLRVNGIYRPLVVQKESNLVLKGNNTLQAVMALGWETVPCVYMDVDDDEARRILLADNRLADKAGYFNSILSSVLFDLDSLDGTGFSPDDIDDILEDLPAERDPASVLDAPADVKRVATIKVGNLTISTCGKQYSEWEQELIAEGYMSKEERGLRIGQMLELKASMFEVWASVADPTTGHNEFNG